MLYILRVGVVDQMTEPTQRSFIAILGKQVCWSDLRLLIMSFDVYNCTFTSYMYLFDMLQLQSPDSSSPMKVAALRTLSYTLKTLGEVRHN